MSRHTHWSKERDQHLKDNYGPHQRTDPAVIALCLGLAEKTIIIRLSQLGLRSRRAERNVQACQIGTSRLWYYGETVRWRCSSLWLTPTLSDFAAWGSFFETKKRLKCGCGLTCLRVSVDVIQCRYISLAR